MPAGSANVSAVNKLCPRCQEPVLPALARCRSCGQILSHVEAASPATVASPKPVETPRLDEVRPKPSESETHADMDRGAPLPPSSDLLRIACSCGKSLRVQSTLRGKRVKCPQCATLIVVGETKIADAIIAKPQAAKSNSLVPDKPLSRASLNEESLPREIERASQVPVPPEVESTPDGKLSASKRRKLYKQLEVQNPLSDTETITRRQALLELGQSRDRSVLTDLLDYVDDHSPLIREGAITAIGDLGDPAGVPAVLKTLLDRDADVLRAVFTALKKFGDGRVVRSLLLFGLERPEWKALANDTLVKLGPRVSQELSHILQANNAGMALEAIVVLGRIGDRRTVPALMGCLDHVSNLLRAHVFEALALIGDALAVPALLRALTDSVPIVRANAAAGLSRMSDPRALHPLIRALQDEDNDVRRYAAVALGELGDVQAVPELIKVLTAWEDLIGLDPPYLEAVIEALGKLADVRATAALVPLLKATHHVLVLKAVLALKKIRDPTAVPAMAALVRSPKPEVRRRVVEALGQSGDTSVVPTIVQLLKEDPTTDVRCAAARALGELRAKDATSALEDLLRDETPVRVQAIIALGAIRERNTLAALMAMLKDGLPEVRFHAINAIAKFQEPKTAKAIAVLLQDTDPMVRGAVAKALEQFGEAAKDKAVKNIVRRARTRILLGKLVPAWVFLFVPHTRAAKGTLAAVVAGLLLMPLVIRVAVGGPNKVLVRGNVQSLSLNADGSVLVAERTLGMLEVWDVKSRSVKSATDASGCRRPQFRANGETVLLKEMSVVPWPLSSKLDATKGWTEHKHPIQECAITANGRFAVTMSKDMIAVTWDLQTGRKQSEAEINERFPNALAISADGQRLATANRLGEANVIEADGGKEVRRLPGGGSGSKPVTALAFSPDGQWLAAAEQSGGVKRWDLTAPVDDPVVQKLNAKVPLRAVGFYFCGDSRRVLTADPGGEVRAWDFEKEDSQPLFSAEIDQVDGFAISADESRIALGGNANSAVLIYDVESAELINTLDVRRR